MKLTFLGVSSALSSGYNSNILIENEENVMLFDCGEDIKHSLAAAGRKAEEISSVYISHLHSDHSYGLSWLGYYSYFIIQKKIKLYIHESMVSDLWAMLRPAMEKLDGQDMMTLDDYFDVEAIKNEHFSFGNRPFGLTFQIVRQCHIETYQGNMYSYGLRMSESSRDGWQAFISSDSKKIEIPWTDDYIFCDCDVMNLSGVHPNYNDLKQFSDETKKNVWLYHYTDLGDKMPDAVADGFAGFVKEGQIFEI